MIEPTVYTLVNRQSGNLAFKILPFADNRHFDHLQRNNFFSLILITKGVGKAKADFTEYDFGANTLFSFYPYQPFMLAAPAGIEGFAIQFHHDFFCIHRHHKEIGCNGVLFNNIYQQPFIVLDETTLPSFLLLIQQIMQEMKAGGPLQDEVIVSFLKVFLINATRIKIRQQPLSQMYQTNSSRLFVLQNLKDAIEENYRHKHSAGDYAALLHISVNALARISKTYFNKTLSDLIAERIIIEAKRELYLTKKPVKAIAWELGYEDEYYFSRFFKTNADVSPQLYRETVGFGRGDE